MTIGIRQTALVALTIGLGGAAILLLPPYPAAAAIWPLLTLAR